MSAQSEPEFDRRSLADLVERLCNGDLAPAAAGELEKQVVADPAARRYYVRYLNLHASLPWVVGVAHDASAAHTDSKSPLDPAAPSRVLIFGFPTDALRHLPGGEFTVGLLLLFAVVGTVWGLMAFVFNPARDRKAPSAQALTPTDAGRLREIAKLVGVDGCRWGSRSEAPRPGSELKAGVFELLAGIAEIEFGDGARVLVAGPSEFEICDRARMRLQAGHLRANVPRHAIGFTIHTPTADIVDLGTEFGVTAAKSGYTEVQVYRGRVAVQPVSQQPDSAPPNSFIMRAGEARRIERRAPNESVAVNDVDGPQSERGIEDSTGARPGSPFPDTLVAYWSFDDAQDSGPAAGSATTTGEVQFAPGLVGRGAAISAGRGAVLRARVQRADAMFDYGLTVELLFSSSWSGRKTNDLFRQQEPDGATTIGLGFASDPTGSGRPCLAWTVATDCGPQRLALALDGRDGRPSLAELTDGRPHHVVATFDGIPGRMALFVDGSQAADRSIEAGARVDSFVQHAAQANDKSGQPDDPLSGVLDEVAVYRAALLPREIARHWQNVSAGHPYFAKP